MRRSSVAPTSSASSITTGGSPGAGIEELRELRVDDHERVVGREDASPSLGDELLDGRQAHRQRQHHGRGAAEPGGFDRGHEGTSRRAEDRDVRTGSHTPGLEGGGHAPGVVVQFGPRHTLFGPGGTGCRPEERHRAGCPGGGFQARNDRQAARHAVPTRGTGLGLRPTEYRGGDVMEEPRPWEHRVGARGAGRVLGGPVDVGTEGDDSRGRSNVPYACDRIGLAREVDDHDLGPGALRGFAHELDGAERTREARPVHQVGHERDDTHRARLGGAALADRRRRRIRPVTTRRENYPGGSGRTDATTTTARGSAKRLCTIAWRTSTWT